MLNLSLYTAVVLPTPYAHITHQTSVIWEVFKGFYFIYLFYVNIYVSVYFVVMDFIVFLVFVHLLSPFIVSL